MSRSYKKNPVTTNSGSYYRRFAKNYANRQIRRSAEAYDGSWSKKFTERWTICDFKCRWTPEQRVRMNYKTGELYWDDDGPEWKARMK
jgi:hypothetical protein